MAVRGYADWKPKGEAAYWTNRAIDVLTAYRKEWPLSNRQLFYRLVAEHAYDKTEKAYNNLTQMVSRARRAGYIEWQAIRDGGLGDTKESIFFDSAEHFQRRVLETAKAMQLNRQRGQSQVIELWCEAGGMFPILQGIANPYSCRANTGGGYDSVTAKHELALRVLNRAKGGLPTLVLHVGDFDGSGENMCEVLREDAGAMVRTQIIRGLARTAKQLEGHEHDFQEAPPDVWREVEAVVRKDEGAVITWSTVDWVESFFRVERVALTGDQVVERNVITAPPKKSDSRTAGFVERNWEVVEALGTDDISAQLEALTPQDLRDLVTDVIEEHLDMDIYNQVLEDEQNVRDDLVERLT